jgi:hypothetical protein
MQYRQGRVTGVDCRQAVDEVLKRYPGAKIRWMQYVGRLDGKEWWEFLAEEVSA